jgi:antitoxin component YwqK of YwqJK toxin-antitoxin module
VSNGQLNGVSEGWFTNGVLQIREHFMDGSSEGPVTKWHSSGAKLSE